MRRRVPFTEMDGSAGNDVWGWHDRQTDKEYALVGMTTGTAFVDVSDPESPIVLGTLPSSAGASGWRDVKVYRDHAYIVADAAGAHGMQVFDLTRLRSALPSQIYSADFVYTDFQEAHNIAVNESTGFAYAVGTDTCNGGLHMIDLSDPVSPVFAGCYSAAETHDTQCVVYHGPDAQYAEREICVSSNENHVGIVDVSDKSAPVHLSEIAYIRLGFVHQGWLSEDHAYFFLGDELDELGFGGGTRTHVFDVSDLDAPTYMFAYESTSRATDHNLYVRGNRLYEGNYSSGLRVLDLSDVSAGSLSEIAYFDTYPASNAPGFDGVWSVYPYLPSGTLLVNDRENGLFLLTMELATAFATISTEAAMERDTIDLRGVIAGNGQGIHWMQTGGPPAFIAADTQTNTVVTLPDLSSTERLTFELVVDDGSGRIASDTVEVLVSAYPSISSAPLDDPTLQQCVDSLAVTGSLEDTGQVTLVDCDDVDDIGGIEAFTNLRSLTLRGNALSELSLLAGLPNLQTLDLSGNSSLPCDELTALESALDSSASFSADDSCRLSTVLDLGLFASDSEIDLQRRRVYVSIHSLNEIVVADLDSREITDRIPVPGTPRGIDLSEDGTRLFAALKGSDAVLELMLDTGAQRLIPLGGVAGSALTYDVVEAVPDRLFVTAEGRGAGPAYIVQARLDQGDAVTQVADQQAIQYLPALAVSQGTQSVYVGNAVMLYKLSLADAQAGVILQGPAPIGGAGELAIDATGAHIALGTGPVLRTDSFIEQGQIPAGAVTASENGDLFAVNALAGVVEFYDPQTLELVFTADSACDLGGAADQLHSFNLDRNYVLLRRDALCLAVDAPRTTLPDPYPDLHFIDLAFERCVRAKAQAEGWTVPADFLELDCSASPTEIRRITGIEAMTNLTMLDISNSSVLDLQILRAMPALHTLIIRNSPIAFLQFVETPPQLAVLDVRGSHNVACDRLDELAVNDGVAVSADSCTRFRSVDLGAFAHDLELDEAANRAFVSVPSLHSILEVDLGTFTVVRTIVTTDAPYGIDLARDGMTIYAAIGNIGALAFIDEATGVEQLIDLLAVLGSGNTYDVAEVSADRIVVSAREPLGGSAYIAEVRRDLANATQRVADQQIIRASPEFVVAPDQSAVFVSNDGSSIYELDATQSSLPIAAVSASGAVNPGEHLRISSDGRLLAWSGGQLFSTETMSQVGAVPRGLSVFDTSDRSLLVADGAGRVGVYDIASLQRIAERHWGCFELYETRLEALSSGQVLFLGTDSLCSSEIVAY